MEVINTAMNALNTATSFVSGVSNSNTGKSFAVGDNPYSNLYNDSAGFIFGKPLAFNPKADPNQRVFQRTLLRNDTIVNFVPGVPYTNQSMVDQANAILTEHREKLDILLNAPVPDEKAIASLCQDTQDALLSQQCDLRYYTFKQDVAGFLRALQIMVNRVGTSVFGWNQGVSGFVSDLVATNVSEDMMLRGFKVWVDKATSISESVDNSFTQSVLESTQKSMSSAVKQARFLGGAANIAGMNAESVVKSSDANLEAVGKLNELASRTLAGSSFQFPQVFDDSKFSRSYELYFRFMSPYGDDRSVFYHVLFPFLAMLTAALPRQDNISGYTSPFIMQVDAPGYFSCPMGVVTALSFIKGGDEKLFNNRGLPLIIEGTLSIQDLYANLSLPLSFDQFATNLGTSAFLSNMGGMSLYSVMDVSARNYVQNWSKDTLTKFIQPYNWMTEESLKVRRYFGIY